MKLPSKKEIIAIMQFIIAALCFLNYSKIDLYDTPMYDTRIFEHQCVNLALGFASLYYALGTWLWYSNYARTRMIARIHSIFVYAILVVLLYLSRFRFMVDYGELLRGAFDRSVFDDEDERMATNLLLMHIIAGLTAIVILLQLYYVIRRIVVVIKAKRND